MMSLLRKSQRRVERVNYKTFSNPPIFSQLGMLKGKKRETWSTSKLYELVILDSKHVNGHSLVKVHYTEDKWSSASYDEWRLASEILDIPQYYITYTEQVKVCFFAGLRNTIKEALHCQRKVDTLTILSLAIPRDLFHEISIVGKFASKGIYHLNNITHFNVFLDENWFFRIINNQGDFAYVTPKTCSFWLIEKKPLEEYSPEGILSLTHRGYCFKMRFARGIGNKYDFDNFFKQFS